MSTADDPLPMAEPHDERSNDPDHGSDLGTQTSTEQGPHGHDDLIGGEWCAANSGAVLESRDPADDRIVIGSYAASDASDVAAAVRAAEDAACDWRRAPAPRRGEILYAFGALLTGSAVASTPGPRSDRSSRPRPWSAPATTSRSGGRMARNC